MVQPLISLRNETTPLFCDGIITNRTEKHADGILNNVLEPVAMINSVSIYLTGISWCSGERQKWEKERGDFKNAHLSPNGCFGQRPMFNFQLL